MRKRLVVVIPNYRTHQLTVDCLASLDGQIERERDAVIVIENGSKDGSALKLRRTIASRGWEPWVRVIELETNMGFAVACNTGITAEEANAYLLLNNDTIVQPRAIASLLTAMRSRANAGIITPKQLDPDGTAQSFCFRYISPVSEFLRAASTGFLARLLRRYGLKIETSDKVIEAEWVCFACVLIRQEVIEKVGLLDPRYFLMYDDVDYSRRARNAGWSVLFWPDAAIVHLGNASNPLGALSARRKRLPHYHYASRALYFAKFYGRLGLWIANLLWTGGRMISLAREVLGKKGSPVCEKEWRDIWTNWLNPYRPCRPWEPTSADGDQKSWQLRSLSPKEEGDQGVNRRS